MKKTIFCSVCLILLAFSALAQGGYRPFPTTNALWSQDMTGVLEPIEFEDYTCGDTTFGGQAYTKVFTHIRAFGGGESTYLQGSIREAGKQVFFYKFPENIEFLLYDFSLQIGDTIEVKRSVEENIQLFTMRVLSIDSVTLTDGVHKRWKLKSVFSADFPETWVEGVGSTFGLVSRTLGYVGGTPPKLNCTLQAGATIYTLPNYPPCDFTLSAECQEMVAVHTPENTSAVVFPNPFSEKLSVSLPADHVSCALRLYDCFGKLLRSANVSGQPTFTWLRDGLPTGIYFLKIEKQGESNSGSVLKIIAL